MSKPKTKPKTVRVRVSFEYELRRRARYHGTQLNGIALWWQKHSPRYLDRLIVEILPVPTERVPEKRDSGSADRNHAG